MKGRTYQEKVAGMINLGDRVVAHLAMIVSVVNDNTDALLGPSERVEVENGAGSFRCHTVQAQYIRPRLARHVTLGSR